MNSKIEYLIVDTSAFIQNASLQEIGNKIITEPGVVNEIKSKRQLRRLVVLPYDLDLKEAYPEDIKFVTDFAKKTGDYTSLSAIDIKVLALTYRYEKEKVGIDHLRTVPQITKEVVDTRAAQIEDRPQNVVGFYIPEKGETEKNVNISEQDDCNEKDLSKELDSSKNDVMLQDKTKNEDCKTPVLEDIDTPYDSSSDISENRDEVYENTCSNQLEELNNKFVKLNCDYNNLEIEGCDQYTDDDILKKIIPDDGQLQNEESSSENDQNVDEDDDDDSGWITPINIKEAKKQMNSEIVKEKPAVVACLTTDFAMQNVLMQIGLNVATLDGKVIKQMRTFILRCYTCFKTTGVLTKIFCPSCGYKTLKKVGVSLNDEGKIKIHINFKKPLNLKGKRIPTPIFKGGKHASNPIIFEDQPLPDQRPTKLARTKTDPLNDDYIAGYSPFAMRDVTSKSAILGIRSGQNIKQLLGKPKEHRRRPK